MDIWLIYLIKVFLLPPSSLLFIALFGGFCIRKGIPKGWPLLMTPLLILFFISLPVVAISLGKLYEKYPAIDFSDLTESKPQVIVVLGGGTTVFSPEYGVDATVNGRSLLRVRYAASLVKQISLPILLSGGNVFKSEGMSEASLMADVLKNEFHTPVKWLETHSRNTAENAFFSRKILEKEEIESIVLVTHAMHMSRAVEQFERVGFKVLPAPTVFLSMSDISLLSFLPSASALEISASVIHEWLGRAWYMLRY